MRSRSIVQGLGLALTLLVTLALVRADEPADTNPAGRLRRLVEQLGSDSFAERDQARKDLETIGTPALSALRKAMNVGDLEMSRRAADLIRVIENKAANAEMLAAKKVRLQLQDVPVLDAVARLAKQSGYMVRVDGDRTLVTGKTVTLDTGPVTFWEALDQLGAKAGLTVKQTIALVPDEPGNPNMQLIQEEFGIVRARKPGKINAPPPPPLRIMPLPKKPANLPMKPEAAPEPPQKKATDQEIIDRLDKLIAEQEAKARDTQAAEAAKTPVVPGLVILMPSPATAEEISYAGAVRVSLKPAKSPIKAKTPAKYYDLVLDAAAEPRLLGFVPMGVPSIAQAIDEHGQVLSFVIDPPTEAKPKRPDPLLEAINNLGDVDIDIQYMNERRLGPAGPTGVTVRLQAGAKPAKRLKELSGSVSAQILVPNTTLAVQDLNATNKTADLKGGGRMVFQRFDKTDVGLLYTVVYALDGLPGLGSPNVQAVRKVGGKTVIQNNVPGQDQVPEMLDSKGNRLERVQGPMISHESGPDGTPIKAIVTVVFSRTKGQGEPTRLLLTGTHTATVSVPFRFVNVTLP